jgi:prevent-host-death family protein
MTHIPAWTVAAAKAKLGQVIDQARTGPQRITRNGRPAAVVVSVEDWERRTRRTGNLAEFLAASPLPGSGLKLTGSKDGQFGAMDGRIAATATVREMTMVTRNVADFAGTLEHVVNPWAAA